MSRVNIEFGRPPNFYMMYKLESSIRIHRPTGLMNFRQNIFYIPYTRDYRLAIWLVNRFEAYGILCTKMWMLNQRLNEELNESRIKHVSFIKPFVQQLHRVFLGSNQYPVGDRCWRMRRISERLHNGRHVDYAAGWRKLHVHVGYLQSARAFLELAIVKFRRLISAQLIGAIERSSGDQSTRWSCWRHIDESNIEHLAIVWTAEEIK
jgi:hypothetical protein